MGEAAVGSGANEALSSREEGRTSLEQYSAN